MSLALLQSK